MTTLSTPSSLALVPHCRLLHYHVRRQILDLQPLIFTDQSATRLVLFAVPAEPKSLRPNRFNASRIER